MTVKEQLYAKLAEVEALLLEAQCDGEQLAELDCYADVDNALADLTNKVYYYVD